MGILKGFDSKMRLVGEQYQDIKETLDSHLETLASHTDMIGALAEDVAIIKNTQTRKVDREEFGGHEKRISVLETKSGR